MDLKFKMRCEVAVGWKEEGKDDCHVFAFVCRKPLRASAESGQAFAILAGAE